jgi:hypothetical protein
VVGDPLALAAPPRSSAVTTVAIVPSRRALLRVFVRFIVSFRDVITGYLRRQRWEAAFLDKLTPGLTRPLPSFAKRRPVAVAIDVSTR